LIRCQVSDHSLQSCCAQLALISSLAELCELHPDTAVPLELLGFDQGR
jgi:hypothetical protein